MPSGESSVTFSRGELARLSGVHPETIRFYERNGLLSPAARSRLGHRLYPAAVVAELRLIRVARALGFGLNELGEIMNALRPGTGGGNDVTARALGAIEARLRSLEALRQALLDTLGGASAPP